MERTEQQEGRLWVLSCYAAYVDALRQYGLDPDAAEVRQSRRALARAIERACRQDPQLLTDFKRAFATRPLS